MSAHPRRTHPLIVEPQRAVQSRGWASLLVVGGEGGPSSCLDGGGDSSVRGSVWGAVRGVGAVGRSRSAGVAFEWGLMTLAGVGNGGVEPGLAGSRGWPER